MELISPLFEGRSKTVSLRTFQIIINILFMKDQQMGKIYVNYSPQQNVKIA